MIGGTGRRADTFGHPMGVKVLPRSIWEGLEAFKHIITEVGGHVVADHEHSSNMSFQAVDKQGKPCTILVDMTIYETNKIKIISRREGLNGSVPSPYPWAIYMTFSRPGHYGATVIGTPVIASFPATMTAVHFAYHCVRTLVTEWRDRLPDVPFPGVRAIKMPDGVEVKLEQLALPASG